MSTNGKRIDLEIKDSQNDDAALAAEWAQVAGALASKQTM